MGYYDIYRKRLNRYGTDYQSRIQGQREREFDDYLKKTIYLVNFDYDDENHLASLEHFNQDYTETVAYLLTKVNLSLPNGTILDIHNQDGTTVQWMIWWLQSIEASGYNRYTVLKMTHQIKWRAADGEIESWAYFSGPGTTKITDTIRTAANQPRYSENNNLHMFILPSQVTLKNGVYIQVLNDIVDQNYIVKEADNVSTLGVGYISVDPTYERNEQEVLTPQPNEPIDDYFWLNGGH